jgi:hypothetical protein
MGLYMVQGIYTAETVATMTKNPQDRSVAMRELAQAIVSTMDKLRIW